MKSYVYLILVVLLAFGRTTFAQVNDWTWVDAQFHWNGPNAKFNAEASTRTQWTQNTSYQHLFRFTRQKSITDKYRRNLGAAGLISSVGKYGDVDGAELRYFDGWKLSLKTRKRLITSLYLRNEVRFFFVFNDVDFDKVTIGDRIRVRPEISYLLFQRPDRSSIFRIFSDVEYLANVNFFNLENGIGSHLRLRGGFLWTINTHWRVESTYMFEFNFTGGTDRQVARVALAYFL